MILYWFHIQLKSVHLKNIDSLFEKSLGVTKISQRRKLYEKMDSIIISQAPVVPLYYDEVVQFVQKNVRGLRPNPQNFLNLKKVRKVNISQ